MKPFRPKSLLAACLLAAGVLAGCTEEPPPQSIQSAVVGLPPKCLPGMRCRKLDPPVKGPKGETLSFDCYGGCGASCNLAGLKTETVERCQEDPGLPVQHRIVKYDLTTGNTHPFCRWHDACYLECAKAYGDGGKTYDNCVAMCDYACVNPYAMNRSCTKGKYAPGIWNRNACGAVAIQRVDDPDKYVPICCKAGMAPDPSANAPKGWARPADCVAWASTAQGPNPVANAAPADGTVTFSELSVIGEWKAGACPAGKPKVAAAAALRADDDVALAAEDEDIERLVAAAGEGYTYGSPDMGTGGVRDMATSGVRDMATGGGIADLSTGGVRDMGTNSDGGATAEVCEPEDELCEDPQCNVATCRSDLPPGFIQPVLSCPDGGTPSDGGARDAGVPRLDASVPRLDASVPRLDAGSISQPDLRYTPWYDAAIYTW